MEKKPDAFNRRFIEWSFAHGCPLLMKYDNETEWKPMKTKYFNWNACNYKINDLSHQMYYERLYAHGLGN